jgi:hypothetical protein
MTLHLDGRYYGESPRRSQVLPGDDGLKEVRRGYAAPVSRNVARKRVAASLCERISGWTYWVREARSSCRTNPGRFIALSLEVFVRSPSLGRPVTFASSLALIAAAAVGIWSRPGDANGLGAASGGSVTGVRVDDKPVYRSATINPAPSGGSIPVPAFGNFVGRFAYARNQSGLNYPKLVALTMTNSGETNYFGAPTPGPDSSQPDTAGSTSGAGIGTGSPLCYLMATVQGTRRITFAGGTLRADLHSAHLQPGSTYSMYVYSGNELVGTIPLGVASPQHAVHFSSPLAGVSIEARTPLFMEVVGQGP